MAAMIDSVSRRPEQVALQAQITALADRFGLSPKSRRMLQWEITRANENQGSGTSSPTPIRQRRLRAVG
jgi:phage terminase small subunit